MGFTASHPTSGILWRTSAGAGAGRRETGDGAPDPLECHPMSQLSLFRPERPEPPRRPPDLPYIRKSLHSRLRTVRDAEIMPWSEGEMASWEKLFPELAAYLPADEAE